MTTPPSPARGADGLLVVTPYYNRPPQEGLVGHFTRVHHAVRLPIILPDVPARTGCQLAVATVARLARLPRVVGIKDAIADLSRPGQLREAAGDLFRLYSGDDATALDFLAAGGDGCISVLSNVVPSDCARLHTLWREGRRDEARAAYRALQPLVQALSRGMSDEVRPPLCTARAETRVTLAATLAQRRGLAAPSLPEDAAAAFGAYL